MFRQKYKPASENFLKLYWTDFCKAKVVGLRHYFVRLFVYLFYLFFLRPTFSFCLFVCFVFLFFYFSLVYLVCFFLSIAFFLSLVVYLFISSSQSPSSGCLVVFLLRVCLKKSTQTVKLWCIWSLKADSMQSLKHKPGMKKTVFANSPLLSKGPLSYNISDMMSYSGKMRGETSDPCVFESLRRRREEANS